MKKIACIAMAVILSTSLLAGAAVAKPHGGGSPGKSSKGSVHRVKESKAQGKAKDSKQPEKAFKKQIRDKVKNEIKEKNRERINQIIKEKLKKQKQHQIQVKEFKDIEKHWAGDSIKRLQMLGVVSGYEDGTFKPDNEVTEAETIAVLMRLFDEGSTEEIEETETVEAESNDDQLTSEDEEENVDEEETVNEEEIVDEEDTEDADESSLTEDDEEDAADEEDLNDIPAWAKESVKKAAQKKIININRFHSHVQATRAQTAVWVAKAMDLEPVDTSDIPFEDGILISPEDAGYIMALVEEGVISGTPDGRFNPNSAITRAELAAILDRVLQEELEESEEGEEGEESSTNEQTDDTAVDENTEDNSDSTADENNDEESSDDTAAADANDENLTETEEESAVEDSTAETETAGQ